MPALAPAPTPTMIDIGVARPNAQGQAMMRTATEATRACARRGSGPTFAQIAKVRTETASTAGTNQAATRSASRWMGARLLWASATMRTMRASSVSLPTLSADMISHPNPFKVPPSTLSPARFSAGSGSPVIID
jgi:hypothetical protein